MHWGVWSYFITGGVSLLGHALTFQSISHRSGGYADLGLVFILYPSMAVNGIWGLTFPFILYNLLDPNLPPVLLWTFILGGGLMHTICGVASIWINAQIAEEIRRSR